MPTKKSTTFTAADADLWDDTELLAVYNRFMSGEDAQAPAQSNANDDGAVKSNASDVFFSEGSSDAGGRRDDDDEEEASGLHLQLTEDRSSVGHLALGVSALPKEVQSLVQSFYQAGFEAGRFVERQKHAKKRGRGE